MADNGDRVISLAHEGARGYRLKYSLGGVVHSTHIHDYEQALARKKELEDAIKEGTYSSAKKCKKSKALPRRFTKSPGNGQDWLDLLWHLSLETAKGDPMAGRKLQIISGAARSATSLLDRSKVEQEQVELRRLMGEVMGSQKYGTKMNATRIQRRDSTVATDAITPSASH